MGGGGAVEANAAHSFDYDMVVIGGGSGGLAASKEAAKLGKKVACLDFVTPSPQGTKWGLGGTCVNVGCIPKKLMHQAGILGEGFSDARAYGWNVPEPGSENAIKHDWPNMVNAIQDHIGSLNWGYKTALRDNGVTYINAKGKLLDAHTIECTKKNGSTSTVTAQTIVIAVGGRPAYPGVEGDKECCLTSDDIFSLDTPPGKTLCIGASYISLETAGFLNALGYDTSVMARSIFLRGFDQEIAEHIAGYMERQGVKMVRRCSPKKFEKVKDESGADKIKVTYTNSDFGFDVEMLFDTVIVATGRRADTVNLGLEAAGVEFDGKIGKIPVNEFEQTNVANIFAIGDVLESRQELTPVAIKAGTLLARRLYGKGTRKMDYNLVPTTVFTPLEYGCTGYSEEDAIEKFGKDNIESYISYLKPLEWTMNHAEHNGQAVREENVCFMKILTNKADNERVVGFHYCGPNAGEITQGIAVAMKVGCTKFDLDETVGIHPTVAEEMTILDVTKASGLDAKKKGC